MAVLAFEFETYEPTKATFTDVKSTDWFYPYVETAAHYEVVKGKTTTTFAPGEAINRADGAVMTVRAQTAEAPAEGEGEGEGEEVTAGGLEVTLSDNSPAGVTIGDGTAYNTMLTLRLEAGDEDASVEEITVSKTGLTLDSNVAGVSVWVGDERYGNIVTVSENQATVSFTSNPIEIAAGEYVDVDVKINIDAAAGSGTMQWYIAEAGDVDAGGGEVSGDFPIYGETFGTVDGSTMVGTLVVDSSTISTSTRQVDVGVTDQMISKFSFQAGANEKVWIHQITLRNNGNATDDDVVNLAFVDQLGEDLALVEAGTTDKELVFNFDDPIELDKGTTKYFTIEGDVEKGSTRTVQFLIDNDYDIVAYGDSTESGILATAGAALEGSSFPVGDTSPSSATFNQITVKEGSMTVSKDTSSPSGNIGVGSKDVVFGTWKLEAIGEEIEVRKVGFDLDSGDVGSLGTTSGLTGTVKLVKDYGSDSETTIYSIAANDADLYDDDTATSTTDQFTLSTYFTVPASESATLSVVGDVASTATAGQYLTAELGDVYYKKMSSNTLATAATTEILGNLLTAVSASVSLSADSTFGSQTVVAGGGSTKVGSFTLQAGSAEGISVQTIILDVTVGGATAIDEVTNLKIMSGGKQIGSTIAGPTATDNSFTVSGELPIEKASNATVEVYADISTAAATSTATGSILTLVQAASDVVYVGDVSQTSSSTGIAATNFQTMTVRAGGTLTITAGNQVSSGVMHSAETGREMLSFKLAAAYENVNVTQVLIETTNGGSNLKNITLKDSIGTPLKTGISVVSDNITLSGLTITVPKNTTKTYYVYADSTSSGTLVSAEKISFRLGSVDAVGVNSGSTITETTVTSELGADSSLGHYPVGAMVFESTGYDDFGVVTTAAPNEGVDLNTTGITMAKDSAAAAANTVAATERFAKMPGVLEACVISTTACTNSIAKGDITYVYDVSTTANTGFFFNDTAKAAATLVTGGLVSGYSLNAAGTDLTADITLAAGDTIVMFKSGMVTYNTSNTSTSTALTAGDVVSFVDAGTVGNNGFYLMDATVAAGTDLTAGAGVLDATGEAAINGVTVAATDTDFVSKLNTVSTEDVTTLGTTTATYEYHPGDIVFVHKGTDNAANGAQWAVVANEVLPGTTLTATVLGANITLASGSVITKVFEDALVDSNIAVAHDSELLITNSSTSIPTAITGTTQVVGIFDFTASGDRDINIESILFVCGGSYVTNGEFDDNAMEVWVGGQQKNTSAENSSSCQTGTGRNVDFATPLEIPAGTTVPVTVKFDTSATSGQATGESIVFKIEGTAGKVAAANASVDWYYTAADPSPGTEPTESSPTTLSDSYPISATTLTY